MNSLFKKKEKKQLEEVENANLETNKEDLADITTNKVENVEKKKVKRIKKRKRKISQKALIVLLLPVVAAAITCAIILVTMNKVYQFEFERNGYQYYMDNKYRISSGSVLRTTDSNEITLISGEVKSSISNMPIYLEETNSLVIPQQMIYVNPRNIEFKKVPAFTIVENTNGNVTMKYGKESINPDGGFLYDGKDLYIFLEATKVNYNDVTVNLSRLSYSEAVYKGMIMNFDLDSLKTYYETTKFEIIATHRDNDYKISLLSDTFENYKGEKCLLFTDPNELASIFD